MCRLERAAIVVNKPGYLSPDPMARDSLSYMPDIAYSVKVGPEMDPLVVKLAPESVITGTIQGSDGEPLEGAKVELLASRTINGRRQLAATDRNAQSDADGNFRFGILMPGRYYLSVRAKGLPLDVLAENGGKTYPRVVYFPASSDIAGAAPLDLAAGQHQEVHFNLGLVPSFKVSGVIATPGEWMQRTTFELVDQVQQLPRFPMDYHGETGVFQLFAVPAGTYWLQLGGRTLDGQNSLSYRQLVVNSDLVNLRFTVLPSLDIPVILRADFAHPNTSGSARVELDSLDLSSLNFQSNAGLLAEPLSVRGVSPGRYAVRVDLNFGGYVQSVQCGALDLMHEPLVVPDDGSVAPIEVVVRDDPGTLMIKVRTDKPGRKTTVLVFTDPVTLSEPRFSASGQAGTLFSGPLPPGFYKILAVDAAEDFDDSPLEILAKYSALATSVRVEANKNLDVVVDPIHVRE